MMTVALTSFSLVAGILIGKRLAFTGKRISALVTVGPTKLALVVRKDLSMSKGNLLSKLRMVNIFSECKQYSIHIKRVICG